MREGHTSVNSKVGMQKNPETGEYMPNILPQSNFGTQSNQYLANLNTLLCNKINEFNQQNGLATILNNQMLGIPQNLV